VIELITHVKSPATLELNGRPVGRSGAGLQVKRIPIRPGRVVLSVKRGGKMVLSVAGDEWITDNPWRTDRLTYGKSTCFDYYCKTRNGNIRPPAPRDFCCRKRKNRCKKMINLPMIGKIVL